jgi:hypothetical protein
MSRWTRRDENAAATAATKRRWKRSRCCTSPSNTCVPASPWPRCIASPDSGATPKPHGACNRPSTCSLSNCARRREENNANQRGFSAEERGKEAQTPPPCLALHSPAQTKPKLLRRLLDSSHKSTQKGAICISCLSRSFRLILRLENTGGLSRLPRLLQLGTGEACPSECGRRW